MTSLWRKELRSMLPFLLLVLFISLLSVLEELFNHQPDLRPLAESAEGYVVLPIQFSYMLFILVFAAGIGILVRDHEEGSLEFLDSLPLSRTQVFVAKFLVAELVLSIAPASNVAIALALHALSRTSLDPVFHLDIVCISLMLHICQITVFLALAMSLSFLRRFAWVVVCVLFWMFILLRDLVPSLAVLNVFALTTPQFDGQHWTLPIEMLKAQLPLAAVLLGVAYLMFIGVGDRLMKGYDKMRETRVGSAALIVCGILAALLGSSVVGWVVLTDPSSDDYDVPAARYVSWTTTRARTRYYSFVYPTNLADRARHLLERADDVHNVVTTFLESEPDSGQIAVDMSSSIARHAGQAYWKAIRLDLLATDNPEVLRGVLGHETTHVIADRVSNSRLTDAFNSIRFFHEGLATYVEHELFGSYETLAPLRAVAATMRHRHLVRFDELVENDRFCRTHDTHLVYPLGEVFVASIVATYGKAAPAALLRSFGRKDAPEGLTGMELWQDTFQATGYNLDQVIDNFYARLDALVDEHRGFVESMPRPRGAVRFESNRVGVQVLADLSDGWGPVCRFRQDMDDPDYQYMYGIEGDSHTFWLDQADLPGATFWYQVGLKETSGDRVIFEPWQQVRKKR